MKLIEGFHRIQSFYNIRVSKIYRRRHMSDGLTQIDNYIGIMQIDIKHDNVFGNS